MNRDIIEAILATIMDQQHDINSNYLLYGKPPMWNLLVHEGRTMAVRPGTAQYRGDFGNVVEEPGFTYGWHVDGEWDRSFQHRTHTRESFSEIVERHIYEGAQPVAPALVSLARGGSAPSP